MRPTVWRMATACQLIPLSSERAGAGKVPECGLLQAPTTHTAQSSCPHALMPFAGAQIEDHIPHEGLDCVAPAHDVLDALAAKAHSRRRSWPHRCGSRRHKRAAHCSKLRSELPMPMARDVDTPAEPHAFMPSHVLEKPDEPAHTPGPPDQPIVQTDREQLGLAPDALAIEHVEGIPHVGEEIIAS